MINVIMAMVILAISPLVEVVVEVVVVVVVPGHPVPVPGCVSWWVFFRCLNIQREVPPS